METNRLLLRRFTQSDAAGFSALIRDKMASPYAVYDHAYPTDDAGLAGVLQYFIRSDEFFAVHLKAENKCIGFIALNRADAATANLGYCIHSGYQGNGYAREAVAAVKEYAKSELQLVRLVSGTAEANMPSVRLLLGAGFHCTGRSTESMASDAAGVPVTFTGLSFECLL